MQNSKDKIIEVARAVINDKIDPIEGARFIVKNRFDIDFIDEEYFYFLIAFSSDADDIPVGDVREYCSERFLREMDNRRNILISSSLEYLKESCKNLIAELEG